MAKDETEGTEGAAPAEHELTLRDGTHVEWESWRLGKPTTAGSGKDAEIRTPIVREDAEVAVFTRRKGTAGQGHADSIEVPEGDGALASVAGSWELTADNQRLEAQLPDGRVFTAAAKDRDKISRAKLLEVTFADSDSNATQIWIECEGSTNYVIEDNNDKLGQFTGANRGIRDAQVQYDTPAGRQLPLEQKIYLQWVARRVLESRVSSASLVMIIFLIFVVLYLAWVWFSG